MQLQNRYMISKFGNTYCKPSSSSTSPQPKSVMLMTFRQAKHSHLPTPIFLKQSSTMSEAEANDIPPAGIANTARRPECVAENKKRQFGRHGCRSDC